MYLHIDLKYDGDLLIERHKIIPFGNFFRGLFLSVFSDRLKTLRGELKQAEFARKVGLAQNTYSRYESGERIPDIEVLVRLAARLGVSTDWLLGLDSKDAVPATTALSEQDAKPRDPVVAAYCPACGQKDVTIACQAESIVNLTRSLAALANLRA